MSCPDCDADDEQSCRPGCPREYRDILRTGINNELNALERELQACWEATPASNDYAKGVRQGLAIAIRGVATRLQK